MKSRSQGAFLSVDNHEKCKINGNNCNSYQSLTTCKTETPTKGVVLQTPVHAILTCKGK